MQSEFILNATVKVVRWNGGEGEIVCLLRVVDLVEYVKASTSHERILSLGSKKSHHFGSQYPLYTLIPFNYGWCSDPDSFRCMFNTEISRRNLFYPDTAQRLADLITNDFLSCFSFKGINDNMSSPITRIVFVVEVLRKFVLVGGAPAGILPAGEEEEEEETGRGGVKLQVEEELGEPRLHDAQDDYLEVELGDILGFLKNHQINKMMMQVSTNGSDQTDELSEVIAAIRIFFYKGRRCGEYECHVCLEGFCQGDEIVRMPCSHLFHKDCAFKWLLRRADSCPLCRSVCKTPII